ncbi:MAG: Rrf2 family transcriptional regulator [Thermodesulfobacteriota bacterium]
MSRHPASDPNDPVLQRAQSMRLTTKSRYGMRLILDLALYGVDKPVPLGDVSKRQKISLKYLEKLIAKLKHAGLVKSYRGPFGGHKLAKSPQDITVGDIVRVLEETSAITNCADKREKVCGICSRAGECVTQWVWIEASRTMFKRLDEINIAMLLNQHDVIVQEVRTYIRVPPSNQTA